MICLKPCADTRKDHEPLSLNAHGILPNAQFHQHTAWVALVKGATKLANGY
jgi:hypothetical protein